ncbi:MAG: hypothetical protein JRH03_12235 [Deltaproteobacteria bacterium]|nr:hypothetical protein [Deltaproteobacteria bacterium]
MHEKDLFKQLAERFDDGQIVGAPMTPSLLKILMLLFTPEEAKVALKLPFQNTPLEEAKSIYPEHGEQTETILDNMAKRGTVFRDNKPGVGKRYRGGVGGNTHLARQTDPAGQRPGAPMAEIPERGVCV